MNTQQILHALDVTDEDLLQEVDRFRITSAKKPNKHYKWIAAVACLCLLCGGIWFLSRESTAPQQDIQIMHPSAHQTSPPTQLSESIAPTESTLPTEDVMLWAPYFNEATAAVDGALRQDVCLFSQELTDKELLSFTPSEKPEWMSIEGYGLFLGNGTLRHIYLVATTTLPEVSVTISIGEEKPFYCYVLPEEPQASYCNGVEYTLTRYTAPDGSVALFGEAKFNDCFYTFSLQGTPDTIAQNEADFAMILQTFAESTISLEDLSAIHAREIPVIFDKPLSHKEALNLEPYGTYFLSEIPESFAEESIRHYQDQYTAYLAGLWTRGYDELSWRVSNLTEEDKHRLTHSEETDRYDLSLYPIPRADSVPEELREVVDNPIFYAEELTPELVWARAYKSDEQGDSSGWRMSFSVLYGDVIIKVSSLKNQDQAVKKLHSALHK